VTPFPAAERAEVIATCSAWYGEHGRDLPWRRPGTTPWGVLVSEVMSQQTPMSRVVGPWTEWMERWPTPDDLAEEEPGAAVAAWGRLGYPRRALRLHACAMAIATEFRGVVPSSYEELIGLPGVGDYTAAAVVSFAFGGRAAVLDTNVRRVLARVETGVANCGSATSRGDRELAARWLPGGDADAARWAVSSMELGALVCVARTPLCAECPVAGHCRWLAAGRPMEGAPVRRGQAWKGTDRQCRGVILDLVRNSDNGVEVEVALRAWHKRPQAEKCLGTLLDDGLLHREGSLLRL
jgi:A/G-specific adenine glycosylase